MRSGASTNDVPCEPLAARAREEAGAILLQSASERHCRTRQKRRLAHNTTNVTGIGSHMMENTSLKSPQKSLIIENQAFGAVLEILAKTAILVILASHFRARVDTPTKSPTWGLA